MKNKGMTYYSFDMNGKLDGCHYYIQDYQGNNREVVNASTNAIEQINHYYSYGGLMGVISTKPNAQNFKYGGKELDLSNGLNLYDFHARQQDAKLGRFNSIDPLAEKFYRLSPYSYCGGDPVNCVDPDGNLTIFINGFHNGLQGGSCVYWGGFDKKVLEYFHETRSQAIYYDGSMGGVFNLLFNLSTPFRDQTGYLDGKMQASNIIKKLAKDKNGNIIEKLRIVSHSMGGAYSKGFVRAIVEYVKRHPELCEGLSIDEYDFAPFEPTFQTSVNGVETFQYSHKNDNVAHNKRENGNVHYMQTSTSENAGHSIQDFIQYINSLPEGHYKFINGQFVKTE